MLAVLALVAAPLSAAQAGPPFATDDPEPTGYGHFEIYLYSQGTSAGGDKTGTALGLSVDYGLLPGLQVSASLPLDYDAPARAKMKFGVSDAELGVKYRFIAEDDAGWRPQISFYPSVAMALGDSGRAMGDKAMHVFLPLWAQKSFGSWTTFGGGGWRANPGRDGRNSWFAGWAVSRQITGSVQLGIEVFGETAQTRGEKTSTGVNMGAIYDLNESLHLVGSAGAVAGNPTASAEPAYYLAVKWTT